MGFFSKIFSGLKKTKDAIAKKISQIFVGELNDEFYEDLEYVLVSSDIGYKASHDIIDSVKIKAKKQHIKKIDDFNKLLKECMADVLNIDKPLKSFPKLIMFVGVNGVGKTTAIGRVANYYRKKGKNVLLVAGDTFRAAASDQLNEWAKRAQVRIVKYAEGADPGAVVYDGISSAIAKGDDVVLVDTAGRLQNKTNLMEELRKINRIVVKEWESKGFNSENYLVIDATTGQNALSQVDAFNEIIGIDGIVLTKLDGTAKGGVVFAIASEYELPVRFVGVGEGVDDIEEFNAKDFVDGIL